MFTSTQYIEGMGKKMAVKWPEATTEERLHALQKEAADFKYAIEESSIVAIADANGAIRYSNHNFRKISHFDADELKGRTGRISRAGDVQ